MRNRHNPKQAKQRTQKKRRRSLGWENYMTKAELVTAIADKASINKNQAKDALEAFIDSVTASLKSGQDVRLVGFGTFKAVSRAAGTARNPRTGETVNRPASKTARFQVGEGLKGALNG
ncbi:HU family DNA-binding protein [Caulobacter sp. NIBR2454]|uniref:HU family DNA-binding protein n=1 Tax=Caulobacter sp. NIBR2454 TaxID=3015996 RepID=UPI0022B6B64C|nr:HU family DNA-binding protein [Caulobacter sp. NIBR2454]